MKKFKSNLQRLQDVRKAMKDRCESSLAESMRALAEAQDQYHSWQEAVATAAEHAAKQTQDKDTSFLECLTHRAWFQHLTASLHQTKEHCRKSEAEVDSRRDDLKKAMMEQKVVENLTSRERQKWVNKIREEEQKEMDEIAIQNSARSNGQRKRIPSDEPESMEES